MLLSVTAALLAGCTRLEEPVGGKEAVSGKDGRITFDVALSIPTNDNPATKAMADAPDIRNIYIVVFGSNNYLNEFVKAMPLNASNEPNLNADGSYNYQKVDGVYKVRFSLEQVDKQRYVHVLANVPEGSVPPEFGYVDDVLGKNIYSSEGADGYWQYLSFPSGIDNDAKNTFNGLKLVRNFAKVSLVATAGSGFTVLGFDLYNVPSRGSFAPFKGLLSDRTFQTSWENAGAARDYADLLAEYPGHLMYGSTLVSPSYVAGDFPTIDPTADPPYLEPSEPKYCYEHPASEENPTYIIAKLEKDGDGGKFYRLDLVDNDGKKSAVIRNYYYTVTVNSIETDGYDTPEEAEANPSDYNFTLSKQTQDIPEISNYGAFMETSYLEKVFTTAQSGVEFKYRYDVNTETSNASDYLPGVVSAINGDGEVTWTTGFDGVGTPDGDGWYTLTYDVADPSAANSAEVLSTFTVTAGEGKKMIRRVVNIISMKQKELQVNTWSHTDNRLTLSFTLPDGLRRSMFPLQFKFQADDADVSGQQILSPQDGDMVSGYEITSSGSVIYFLKDYNYNTYESSVGKTISVTFEAPKDVNPIMYLTDRDNYFVPLMLGKSFATGLSANAIANGIEHETTFEFATTQTGQPITLDLTNLTAVSSSTGTLSGNTYMPTQAGTQRIVLRASTKSDPGTVSISMAGDSETLTIPRYSTYVSGPVTLADKLPLGTGKETTFSFNYTARDLMPVTISAPEVAIFADGSWHNGGCTFTPTAQGVQTLTIRSKTNFKDAGSISLSVPDMTNPASVAITRPTSFIVPKEALSLSGTTHFEPPVYWRADSRESTSGVAGSSTYFNATKNTGNISIDISRLGNEDSTPVYFLYSYTDRVLIFIPVTRYRMAQTMLGDLIGATSESPVNLNFN